MAKIKRFGILKMSCLMGLYGVFIGLVFAVMISLVMMAVSSAFSGVPQDIGAGNVINLFQFSFVYFITLPLLSGIGGFLSGLIFTPLINLILRIIKGLDLDMEFEEYSGNSKIIRAGATPIR